MTSSIDHLRVAICGLARDCLPGLRHNWKALKSATSGCASVDWVIVENDSTDGTREWLNTRAAEDCRVRISGKPVGRKSMPEEGKGDVRPWFSKERIGFMADLRNQYLDEVRNTIGFENLDAILVVDFDVHRLPVGRIRYWLENFSRDCALSSLGTYWRTFFKKGFYDSYAYLEMDDSLPLTEPTILSRRHSLYVAWAGSRKMSEVLSNFGGLAIYPARFLAKARYEALENSDPHVECLCEHVSLHRQLRQDGGKLMIDPQMEISYANPFSDWARYVNMRLRGS